MSGRTPTGDLKVGGQPRVQLLPASVKQRERARGTRRFLVFLVVVAVALVGAGVAAAYLNQRNAQQALDTANEQTSALVAQQAQYEEAARLAQLVGLTEEAERTVTANEIQWLPLAVAISGYVPADVTWSGVALVGPAPWEPALVPEGPLRVPRVAMATLYFDSANFGSVTPFVEMIPALYGFADVKIVTTTFEDGIYTTVVQLTLDADAISGRFTNPAADGTDTTADDDSTDADDASDSTDGSADE